MASRRGARQTPSGRSEADAGPTRSCATASSGACRRGLWLHPLVVADVPLDDESGLTRRVARLKVAGPEPGTNGIEVLPFRHDDHAGAAVLLASSPAQGQHARLTSGERDVVAQ